MAIVDPFIISNVILCAVTFSIFYFNLLIYKRITGGSHAYKCWAKATFFIFIFAVIELISVFVVGSDHFESSDSNEILRLIAVCVNIIGHFYIPIGMLYLISDIGVYHVDHKKIKQLEIWWLFFTLCYLLLFFLLIFNYYVVNIFSTISEVIFVIIWIFTIVVYYPFYKKVKSANLAWTYIFIAIIWAFCEHISAIIRNLGIGYFENIVAIFDVLLGIFFILGFYKLGKSLRAF